MNDGDGQAASARRFNCIMAAFMVVIAGVIAQGTFLTDRAKGDISMPLVFPGVLIALLLTLSVVLVVKTRAQSLPEPEGEPISRAGHAKAAVIFAIAVAYPLSMPVIGFPLATALALAAFSFALGERRYVFIAVYSLLFSAFVYGVFIQALRVPLPLGVFE